MRDDLHHKGVTCTKIIDASPVSLVKITPSCYINRHQSENTGSSISEKFTTSSNNFQVFSMVR